MSIVILILLELPLYQDRREDTLLKLTHFRRHKRKTLKKSPGKISNYPFHKPEEKHLPGKDVTKKVSNVIEKAVTIAKSAKMKKVDFQYLFPDSKIFHLQSIIHWLI